MAQDEEKTIDQLNEEADIAADYLEVPILLWTSTAI